MKKTSIMVGFLIIFSLSNMTSMVGAEHMTEFPTMECENPTTTRIIEVVSDELKFSTDRIQVPKNTCFRMMFHNPDGTEHDFTVQYQGEEYIHMDANSGANDELGTNSTNDGANGELQGLGWATHFYMSPNEDITLQFFCEVPGHNTTMVGDFVIGDGSPASAPGFEVASVLVGFLAIAAVVTFYRKKN